jgi:lipoprotein-anchoring transpeptidase ErfK/SrfK
MSVRFSIPKLTQAAIVGAAMAVGPLGLPGNTTPATPNYPATRTIPTPTQSATPATPNNPATPATPTRNGNSVTAPDSYAETSVVLKLSHRRAYLFRNGRQVASYPVAIGKPGRETPTGDWYVFEKVVNPGWMSFRGDGVVIPPGPRSPLGKRWIGFWSDNKDVIGFHGTPNPESIGKAVSNGCVRMYNSDVIKMFEQVKIGTLVRVIN